MRHSGEQGLKRTSACVVSLRFVFSRELSGCQIKNVKKPFTLTAFTVIPLVKFAFVIITFYHLQLFTKWTAFLYCLTSFPLMICGFNEIFRNTCALCLLFSCFVLMVKDFVVLVHMNHEVYFNNYGWSNISLTPLYHWEENFWPIPLLTGRGLALLCS